MISQKWQSLKRNTVIWLSQGVSPRRLALTLALGFAIGCFPVVGIPTAICALLALTLRLNLPAIQAANYLVMPLQLVLVIPFVRLGGWLLSAGPSKAAGASSLLHSSPLTVVSGLGSLAAHAILAWVIVAVPAVALMTLTLTFLFRRVPALASAQAGG